MNERRLPALDHVAYARTIQTNDPVAILWDFVGQLLAFHAVLTTAYAHLLPRVSRPTLFADLFSGMAGLLLDRLTLTPQEYLHLQRYTLVDHYTAQWSTRDGRLMVASVCNATYRLLGISFSGYLAMYVDGDGHADQAALMPLHAALTTVLQVVTSTQCWIQHKPGLY